MKQVVVITGGSSGIGKSTANLFAQNGFTVYELSRSGQDREGVHHVSADVSDASSVDAAFAQIFAAEGQIDIVINNAGFGISGAAEFTPMSDAHAIFNVNFFGMAAVTHAALPYMREAGRGRIVSMSSVAGDIAIPFQAYYSASKAAVSALSLAIANEVRPYGVTLTVLLPGDVQTGFTAARKKTHLGDDVYGGRIERSVAVMEHDETTGMTCDYVAKRIFRAATRKHVKPMYTVGVKYKLFIAIAKFLPKRLTNRIVYLLYAK